MHTPTLLTGLVAALAISVSANPVPTAQENTLHSLSARDPNPGRLIDKFPFIAGLRHRPSGGRLGRRGIPDGDDEDNDNDDDDDDDEDDTIKLPSGRIIARAPKGPGGARLGKGKSGKGANRPRDVTAGSSGGSNVDDDDEAGNDDDIDGDDAGEGYDEGHLVARDVRKRPSGHGGVPAGGRGRLSKVGPRSVLGRRSQDGKRKVTGPGVPRSYKGPGGPGGTRVGPRSVLDRRSRDGKRKSNGAGGHGGPRGSKGPGGHGGPGGPKRQGGQGGPGGPGGEGH